MATQAPEKSPVISPGHTSGTITDKISLIISSGTPKWFFVAFGISFLMLMMFLYSVIVLFAKGTGIWGLNVPVAWGFAIINFVWWIGIGHAGTLISAILLLLRQEWRTSINRFAEAMTIFAVMCALLFPTIHVGRVWVIWWVFPIPNQRGGP